MATPVNARPTLEVPTAPAVPPAGGRTGPILLIALVVVSLGIAGWLARGRTPLGWSAASSAATLVSAAATDAASISKPCSVVTRNEMATILGAKIVKVTTTLRACSYFTDDTRSAEVETTWTGGRNALAEVKGFNSAPGLFEPVAGIGDEAYMQAAGVLHVLKGDTYVVVNAREYPNELVTESAIARKVVEKLD